jgi:hypothetical protein
MDVTIIVSEHNMILDGYGISAVISALETKTRSVLLLRTWLRVTMTLWGISQVSTKPGHTVVKDVPLELSSSRSSCTSGVGSRYTSSL